MNPEAHKLVEELRAFDLTSKSGSVQASTEAISFIALRTSRLSVIIAEEQAKSADRLERQTDTLISLTRWIVGLTIALLLLTVYLCYHEYCAGQHP